MGADPDPLLLRQLPRAGFGSYGIAPLPGRLDNSDAQVIGPSHIHAIRTILSIAMDAEICTQCHRTITSSEQVIVLDGRVLCSRCALHHQPVEVQKRYVPPPVETVSRRDPWTAPKRRRRQRSGGAGLFRGRMQKLALLLIVIGTAAYVFRAQLKDIIKRNQQPNITIPTSVDPKRIDWGISQLSVVRYGWIKPSGNRTPADRQFGVLVQMVNRSPLPSVNFRKRGLKGAEARWWFRVHEPKADFLNRLWRSVTGAKPVWRHSPWVQAAAITCRWSIKSSTRQSAQAAGFKMKAYVTFVPPAGRDCSWVDLRLFGHNMRATHPLTFRLPKPQVIAALRRP